jgi:hypothetical protein
MAIIEELSEEFNLPYEVIEEYANQTGYDLDRISESSEIPFVGRFGSTRDFAIEQVEEGMVGNLSSYLSMSLYNIRQFAQEEADSRLDNMDDDEIIDNAGLSDSIKDDDNDDNGDDESHVYDLTQNIDIAQNRIEILNDKYSDENTTEGERDDIEFQIKKLENVITENYNEINKIKSKNSDKYTREEAISKGRELLHEEYYFDVYDELINDAVGYFTNNLGYTEESLLDNSNFSIDYYAVERDLRDNCIFIDYNGDVYVFHNSYADGGTLGAGSFAKGGNVPSIEKRVAEVNALIKEGNDKGLEVIDETNTWQAPKKFNLLKVNILK